MLRRMLERAVRGDLQALRIHLDTGPARSGQQGGAQIGQEVRGDQLAGVALPLLVGGVAKRPLGDIVDREVGRHRLHAVVADPEEHCAPEADQEQRADAHASSVDVSPQRRQLPMC